MKRMILSGITVCLCYGSYITGYSQTQRTQSEPQQKPSQPQKPQPKVSLPVEWAEQLASTYDGRESTTKHFDRIKKDGKTPDNIRDWGQALKSLTDVDGVNLLMFVTRYDPIWKDDLLQPSEIDRCIVRTKLLSRQIVGKWKASLEEVQGGEISEVWAVGLLVNSDRPFGAQGFSEQESDILLERLKFVPQDAVKTLAETLVIGKAIAAVTLVKEDWLFSKDGFREPAFQEGLKLLKASISRRK